MGTTDDQNVDPSQLHTPEGGAEEVFDADRASERSMSAAEDGESDVFVAEIIAESQDDHSEKPVNESIDLAEAVNSPVESPVADSGSTSSGELIEAELIGSGQERLDQTPRARSPFAPQYDLGAVNRKQTNSKPIVDSVAAKGGAVGALVLGILAIPGALLTPASSITAVIGLVMGVWGLLSTHRRLAGTGMAFCAVAILLCTIFGGS